MSKWEIGYYQAKANIKPKKESSFSNSFTHFRTIHYSLRYTAELLLLMRKENWDNECYSIAPLLRVYMCGLKQINKLQKE